MKFSRYFTPGILSIALAIGAAGCAEDYDGQLSIPDDSNTIDIIAPVYSMLYEEIRVGSKNVASGTEFTIDFGDGTVKTVKGGLYGYHKYTRPGNYTIKVTAPTYESTSSEIEVGETTGINERTKIFADPDNKRILIVAHRSHTTDKGIAENSLAAVDAAVAAGADVIETDIMATSDGVLCISHDGSELDEEGNRIDISSTPWSVVKNIRLRDRNGNLTDETIPSFEDFLLRGRGKIWFNIDKMDRIPNRFKAYEIVERIGMSQGVFFYGDKCVPDIWSYNPNFHGGKWLGIPADYQGANVYEHFCQASYWPGGGNDVSEALTAGVPIFVNMLHVLTWAIPEYEINESMVDELLRRFPKAAYIQTDCPEELDAYLRSLGRR